MIPFIKKLINPFTNWDFYLIGLFGAAITIFILTRYVPDDFDPMKLLMVLTGSFIYSYFRILFFPNGIFNLNKKSKTNEDKNS
jgi:hypothetical protein